MRTYMAAMALAGWFALLLQFYLFVAVSPGGSIALIATIIRFFSFFTILTNLLVALGLSCSLWMPDSKYGKFFTSPVVRAGSAVYMVVVAIVYSVALRHTWNPQGLHKIADMLLHDVVPIMCVAWWLFLAPKIALRWSDALLWLIYPLAYVAYTFARGALFGWYPYPFIDTGALGYSRVFLNGASLFVGFLAIGLLFVTISRRTAPESPLAQQALPPA